MLHAVCLLYPVNDGQFLAVSRRNSSTSWGLPGGKVDPGESVIDAVVRETFEETGLQIRAGDLVPVYSGTASGAVPAWVTTFLVKPEELSMPEVAPEEGLLVRPMQLDALCHQEHSQFWEYNTKAAKALREFMALAGLS